MSYDNTYDDGQEAEAAQERDNLAQLRSQAAKAGKLERENAMLKAGVDTSTAQGKFFADKYDGALEPAAIKTEFTTLFGAPTPEPAPTGEAPSEPPASETEPEKVAETQSREAFRQGAEAGGQEPPPDPIDAGYAEYQERMAKGTQRDLAAGSVFGALIEGAKAGHPRATG
jgi:hypothetical protein